MQENDAICRRRVRPLTPIATGARPDLKRLRAYSAILFDVYGTLLISGAGEAGLARLDRETSDRLVQLLRRNGVGRPLPQLLDRLDMIVRNAHRTSRKQGIAFPEVDVVQIWQELLGWQDVGRLKRFILEVEWIVNPVYPMPGTQDLLTASRLARIPMGIVSNAQFYTVALLEWFFQGTLESLGFDPRLTFFSWREGHAKPSPFMFERAKAVLADRGILADAVLYVGNDMRNDILPAASVGFNTALFAGDRRSWRPRADDDACRRRRPDLVVTDLRQLAGLPAS
ncbi:MAG TPA: HAD family hydrolase [Desulfosarcina sp.]|nr:HAD family hydrolase [Desulfosarcina sp.]